MIVRRYAHREVFSLWKRLIPGKVIQSQSMVKEVIRNSAIGNATVFLKLKIEPKNNTEIFNLIPARCPFNN